MVGEPDRQTTIVVVDDDSDQRLLFQRWLERAGYDVTAFESGEATLAGLSQTLPDAMCLDLQMPGLSGFETLTRIQTHHPNLPIVILTGDSEIDTVVRAMKLGAYDYLAKPVDRTKLVTTVRNAVERHRLTLRLAELEHAVTGWQRHGLVGESPAMKRLFREIDRVAQTDVTVLIRGESGTGKELVARAIHDASSRAGGPLVAINCAAVPQSLQEAELFGHERGAFTGASGRRAGRFEISDGGTLFLDEVAELGTDLQPKLLRVLQERRFHRVGGTEEISSDFRLMAATHRDLHREVADGRFREDLLFRVAVFEIEVPPLRDRGDDVLLLSDLFARVYGRKHRGKALRVHPDTADHLLAHSWPGNVRELQNAVQRAVVAAEGDVVRPSDLPARVRELPRTPSVVPDAITNDEALAPPGSSMTMEEMERSLIAQTLRQTRGNVSEAARRLGIGRTAMYQKLKKFGLR